MIKKVGLTRKNTIVELYKWCYNTTIKYVHNGEKREKL